MNQDRKKIIINEILYWRKNKLLPEAYCNFLLSLYTEGEGIESTKENQKTPFVLIIVIGSLLPVLLLVTYFTEISTNLQMVLNFIFLIICILGLITQRTNSLFVHIGSIILALFILLLTANVSELIFKGQALYLIGMIFLNCIGWIFVGVILKMRYFLIAGILVSIISVVTLLNI
ncbi:hypothetical protein [Fredinandcohnia sp. FSL W7-1320]|uniref:hypothetical protein n=1 Tax=Fredinandcohnia sp. FSL W7-1320 TaxID=2954540 RepID=UPI0030FDCA01